MSGREAFEAWFRANGPEDELSRPNLHELLDGRYLYGFVELAWQAWQAAERATAQRCVELCLGKIDPEIREIEDDALRQCAAAIRAEYGL